MVVIVAVSRVMGTEVMGGYAFIVTFISMFSVVGQMGLQALLTREVAADRDKSSSYLSAALLLGLGRLDTVLAVAMNGLKGYFHLSPSVSRGVFLDEPQPIPHLRHCDVRGRFHGLGADRLHPFPERVRQRP